MVPVSWIKRADVIVCIVYLWFLSALPLLLSTTQLRVTLARDARQNHKPAYVIKDGLALSVLVFSAAICLFCLQCVRVIWPRVFRGERHGAISKIIAIEWRMLVGTRHALLFIINSVIWLAYGVYVVRITVRQRVLLVMTHSVTDSENILAYKRLPAIHRSRSPCIMSSGCILSHCYLFPNNFSIPVKVSVATRRCWVSF